jgi:hypothetical protein
MAGWVTWIPWGCDLFYGTAAEWEQGSMEPCFGIQGAPTPARQECLT